MKAPKLSHIRYLINLTEEEADRLACLQGEKEELAIWYRATDVELYDSGIYFNVSKPEEASVIYRKLKKLLA